MNPSDSDPAFVRQGQPNAPSPADDDDDRWQPPSRNPRPLLMIVTGASILGVVFSLVSTSDFIQHLDRQVHSIHCSFIPGAGSELGESGCRTVMMSPYSSFFRSSLWGGIPVSLWSLAVFAFLTYRAAVLALRGSAKKDEATFLLAATGLPVVMSLIYGMLSMVKVGATCKVCVGIYISSFGAFLAAFMAWQRTPPDVVEGGYQKPKYPLWFAEGIGFVVALTLVFLAFTPASDAKSKDGGTCGSLVQAADPSGVMIELSSKGKVPSIEVLDPLCPACRAFDVRLNASDLGNELQLSGVLFPLDSSCNWMVTEALHPGACAVSEAVLCANGMGTTKDAQAARDVLAYAFEHQEELRDMASKDESRLRARLERDFPKIKGCLGTAAVKNKLTKSLRWGVANAVPVLTPQLFVKGQRLCDEDTDLGLEYTLRKAIARADKKEAKR